VSASQLEQHLAAGRGEGREFSRRGLRSARSWRCIENRIDAIIGAGGPMQGFLANRFVLTVTPAMPFQPLRSRTGMRHTSRGRCCACSHGDVAGHTRAGVQGDGGFVHALPRSLADLYAASPGRERAGATEPPLTTCRTVRRGHGRAAGSSSPRRHRPTPREASKNSVALPFRSAPSAPECADRSCRRAGGTARLCL